MAKAFKCDVSGALCEGEGVKTIEVAVSKVVDVQARVFVRTGENSREEATVSPEIAEQIRKALAGLKWTAGK